MHLWWVYLHILGGLLFMLAHGASAAVIFRLRRERDPDAVRTLLALSQLTVGPAYIALVLLLVAGIWAGIEIQAWTSGRWWLWASVGVLVLVLGAMYTLLTPTLIRWRQLLGEAGTSVDRAELDAELAKPGPMMGAGLGLVGILVILWLMVFKPF